MPRSVLFRTLALSPIMVASLLLLACQSPLSEVGASDAEAIDLRPRFEITTQEAFSPGDVAPYAGDHTNIYAHIDANQDAHLANLKRWLRQRSISAQNDGITEMAELVRSDLEQAGFSENGHPRSFRHPSN